MYVSVFRIGSMRKYKDFLGPEHKIQARLVSWIRDHPILKSKLFFHIPTEFSLTNYEKYTWNVLGCRADLPDLIFIEPNETHQGLCVELKQETPYKKDGTCKFPEQEAMLEMFRKRGYLAEFQWDYDSAKKIICKYFDL